MALVASEFPAGRLAIRDFVGRERFPSIRKSSMTVSCYNNAHGRAAGVGRNSALAAIAGFLTIWTSFLSSVVIAHLLGVGGTGTVAFAVWIATFARMIGDFGIESSLSRYLPELTGSGDPHLAQRLAALLLRPAAASATVLLVAFASYALWLWHRTQEWSLVGSLSAIVGAAAALQVLAGFTYGRLRGLQQFDRAAVFAALSLVLQLVSLTVGSLLFGVAGALAGYCAGSVIPAASAFFVASGRGVPPELTARVRRFAGFAWGAELLSAIVWSRIEVVFLERSAGSAAVGLFTVGLTLANLASQGPMLLTAGLLPYLAESFGKGAFGELREAFSTATRLLAFLVLPASLGLAAIMPRLLPLMYGHAFADAVPAATIMVVAGAFGATAFPGANLASAMDRSDVNFIAGIAGAVLAVVAGLTVIPSFGVIGAASARAAIQLGTIGFGCWYFVRRLDCPIPFADLCRLLIAASVCGGIARICLIVVGGPTGLAVSILAGAAGYLAAVRVLGALPEGDVRRLRGLLRGLPGPLRLTVECGLSVVHRRTV